MTPRRVLTRRNVQRLILPGLASLLILSCATVREKTETYLLGAAEPPSPPIEAWLRTVEIVSNSLPLSGDYALIRDSLTAIASRHGVRLSAAEAGQPWVVDLVVHAHTYTVDLVTSNDIMAVLNLNPVPDDANKAVRVVYAAVSPGSDVSLYQVTEIAEKVFGSLAARLEEETKARAKAEEDARRAAAKAAQAASSSGAAAAASP